MNFTNFHEKYADTDSSRSICVFFG